MGGVGDSEAAVGRRVIGEGAKAAFVASLRFGARLEEAAGQAGLGCDGVTG